MMMDDATYQDSKAMLHEYLTESLCFIGEYLPYSPLDVDARVYEELGVREFGSYDDDDAMPLVDFIAELRALAASAPKGAEVVIDLTASTGYEGDSPTASYELGYFREPTEDEKAERREVNRKIAERERQREIIAAKKERAEFDRLKAKYDK
jgi:hypothetical protein